MSLRTERYAHFAHLVLCAVWCGVGAVLMGVLLRMPLILLHANGVLTRAEGLESKANATLVHLDKGTGVWAASAKDQAAAVEDLATDAHGTLGQADAALGSVQDSAVALRENLTALRKTVDAATELTAALTADARTANGTIQAAKPLLDASTRAVMDFDALVTSPDLKAALKHVNAMTASGDGILADGRKATDKATADYLRPVKWYWRPLKRAGEFLDIGAAVARNAP